MDTKLQIQISTHALKQVDERLTEFYPELKCPDRLKKEIGMYGKWYENERTKEMFCVVSKRYVGVFRKVDNGILMVTAWRYTKPFKKKMRSLLKIEVETI